jgi:acetoin utilization deacetylase AcuC-like enzyme
MGRVLRLYSSDQFFIVLPASHKFPMAKYGMVRQQLKDIRGITVHPAPLALREEIELAHDPAYTASILDGSVDPRIMRRIGFPWSEQLVARSLASVGGTLAAARAALESGIAGNLAGGTHHAFRAEGSGFCVFNDLAVTIRTLQHQGVIARAAVLDLDVHQGDGTASIFAGDAGVLTVSLHGSNNFPFRKQQSAVDVGLPDGTGDESYLTALQQVLPAVWDFAPDLLLYQSGVDALQQDRLGRLAMTHDGLIRRDRMVFEGARNCGIPVAITMGGGYGDPVEVTAHAHANTFLTAASVWGFATFPPGGTS